MNAVCIWQPKFSTKVVLIDRLKVRSGKNYVFFAADVNHTSLYSYDGDKAKTCPLTTNGKILCYNIPLDWLENEGDLPQELVAIRDREYAKFKRVNKKK